MTKTYSFTLKQNTARFPGDADAKEKYLMKVVHSFMQRGIPTGQRVNFEEVQSLIDGAENAEMLGEDSATAHFGDFTVTAEYQDGEISFTAEEQGDNRSILDDYLSAHDLTRYQVTKKTGLSASILQRASEKKALDMPTKLFASVARCLGTTPGKVLDDLIAMEK